MSTKGLRVPKPECRTRGSSNCLIFPVWSTTHWYFHAQGNRNWNNGCNLESWCFLPLDKEKYNDLVFNLFSLKISAGWVGFLMIFCFVTYYFIFFVFRFLVQCWMPNILIYSDLDWITVTALSCIQWKLIKSSAALLLQLFPGQLLCGSV